MSLFDKFTRSQYPFQPPFVGLSIWGEGYCLIMFFSFSQLFKEQLPIFKYVAAQCEKKRDKGCERECDGEEEYRGEKWKLQNWWLNGRTTNFLILCLTLAKEMENVKSQRGAKNAAQYGTAHQNPPELTKTLVINASAAQNWQRSEFQT